MSNELAKMQNTMDLIPDAGTWQTIRDMAASLLPTGFLPEGIKTAEQAVAIILKGRELRIPPMYALSNIHVIKGKPTVSAEVMLALIQRDLGMDFMWVEESDNTKCTVGYKYAGGSRFYSFTIEDAAKAGLTKSPTWISYPAAMLRARAISATARMAAPGVIAGMYVPGELGDDVDVDDEGHVVSAGEPAPQRMTATVTPIQGEVVDDDGVIEDDAPADDKAWIAADKYFSTICKKHKITDDEKAAVIRKWGFASGDTADIPTERLQQACNFLDQRQDPKRYASTALADERGLAEIADSIGK